MAVLSIHEIYQVARDAGFNPHQAVTWTAIAMAESGGRPTALNDHGEYSVGLWQINVAGDVRDNTYGDLTDPAVNARAAYEISHQGTDMRPWTTTHDHNQGTAADYRRYLPEVEQLIGVRGDGRGVDGYGAELPPPLTGPGYDRIDDGAALATVTAPAVQQDRDTDGLTDEFEQLVGSDATLADTDVDGLSDSYEAVISHTDPLSADSDRDQVLDPTELAAGTDPGTLPGIGGVQGSGELAVNVRESGTDSDADGIVNKIERKVGLDPMAADTDLDTLPDAMEAAQGTDPTSVDSDHDGLADAFELRNQHNPLAATGSTTNTVSAWTYQSALAERTAAAAEDVDQSSTSPASTLSDPTALNTFLQAARAQAGDSYVYGATPSLSAPDPTAFDCSSLTQWAANQAGVELPRIAEAQYMDLKEKDMLIGVEQALQTPGALLFYFSTEPTGPLPAGQAHVAISLGDGRTIEAKGSSYGVGEFSGKGRFNFAGLIPGISDGTADPAASTATLAPATPVTTETYADDDLAPLTETAGMDPSQGPLPGSGGDDRDRDLDGLTDAFERLVGSAVAKIDTDSDGLADGHEAMITHTDPLSADTDDDHQPDAYELAIGSDPGRIPGIGGVQGTGRLAENVRVSRPDSDADGMSDRTEKILGTDPTSADSDADALPDAMERAIGSDPLSVDTDLDGLSDSLELRHQLNPLSPGDTLGGLAMPATSPGSAAGTPQPDPTSTDSGSPFDQG